MKGNICLPQGLYEPVICSAGYYCPPPGREQIRCPKGSYCPQGSFKPLDCGIAAVCPAGSTKRVDLYGFVIMILVDIAIAGVTMGPMLWRKFGGKTCKRKSRRGPKGRANGDLSVPRTATPTSDVEQAASKSSNSLLRGTVQFVESISNHESELTEDLRLLVESFRKCNLGEKNIGLSFDFHDMGFTVKGGKHLLSGVNGRIEAGSMWGIMGPSGAGKSIPLRSHYLSLAPY